MLKVKSVINYISEKQLSENLIFVILIISGIFICISSGLDRIYTSDFSAINGDFQNYNPVRRLLSGQVPFKDFAVYLGAGHLYLNSIFLKLFGNNFTRSLFSSSFLTTGLFLCLVSITSYLVNKKKSLSVAIALVLYLSLSFEFIPLTIRNLLYFASVPGNSARMIRAGSLSLITLFILLSFNILFNIPNKYSKQIFQTNNSIVFKYIHIIVPLFFGSLLGAGILWSNDVGISSYISFSFVFFLSLIFIDFRIIDIVKCCLLYIISSILSFLFTLTLITKGDILSWYTFTMGVSGFQSWYYGCTQEGKIYFFNQVFEPILLIGFILFVAFVFMMFHKSRLFLKELESYRYEQNISKDGLLSFYYYGLLTYVIMTGLISSLMYRIMSGGSYVELLSLIIFSIILANVGKLFILILNRFEKKIKTYKYNMILVFNCIVLIFIGFINFQTITKFSGIKSRFNQREGIYVDYLNGYITNSQMVIDIEKAKEIIGNEDFFSTYASALEVTMNKFQPTGIDYIIHVLGEKQREYYLNSFILGNYRFVVTINPEYNIWEYWIRNANWFFYKELYSHYKPIFYGSYFVIWEKLEHKQAIQKDYKINLKKIDNSCYHLTLETEDKDFNGVVDVQLKYESIFNKNKFDSGAINKFVHVTDTTLLELNNHAQFTSYFVPSAHQGYNVPVTVHNGVGELIINSYPNNIAIFNYFEIMVGSTYNNYFLPHLQIDNLFKLSDLSDNNWSKGLSKYTKAVGEILLFRNNSFNRKFLENAISLKSGDNVIKIIDIEHKSNQWIYVHCKPIENMENFQYPNKLEVIK